MQPSIQVLNTARAGDSLGNLFLYIIIFIVEIFPYSYPESPLFQFRTILSHSSAVHLSNKPGLIFFITSSQILEDYY